MIHRFCVEEPQMQVLLSHASAVLQINWTQIHYATPLAETVQVWFWGNQPPGGLDWRNENPGEGRQKNAAVVT